MAADNLNTNSLAFPNMFDVTRNCVSTYVGNKSIVNRTKLLILTNPTELYNSPTFGVGLKRYLWQYNTANTKAIIQARIKEQLKEHEPYVDSDATSFVDGLLFTGNGEIDGSASSPNELKMTIGLQTIYKDTLDVSVDINEAQAQIFNTNVEG